VTCFAGKPIGFFGAGRNAELEACPPDQFLFRAKYFFDWEEEMARYALEFMEAP
jgi:hypothetical protein